LIALALQKNISPGRLSFISALIIATSVTAGFMMTTGKWWHWLLTFALFYILTFGVFYVSLQNFLFRKIKLIYKMIQQTKASKREEFYYKELLPQKTLEEVSEDVEEWARQHNSEIEMLQKNEAYRKEFLQNLSHELKTPIFSIQGYIDTLLAGALHNEAVNVKFLENAAKNVDRLVRLVDDLDEISSLESGEQKPDYRHFIIQDLIREVYDSLEITAREKEITCSIKKGCESPVTVYADREKIRQVITNIVSNAISYGKQQGKTEAGIYNVDGKTILVEISDDGVGISEEHLPRIFERFYRTDHARSRRAGGSGLGLAICKHIIEAHGQSIHVRSKTDVGTTFGFTLNKVNK
jgi:two-component system phosphate regulon sensor histidine kinase PhoR